jgi:hypothetical protein
LGGRRATHGFKRARWRRLWRQQIQDWLIAAVQNVKLPLRLGGKQSGSTAAAVRAVVFSLLFQALSWSAGEER